MKGMKEFYDRLGVWPSLLLGAGLFTLGLLALDRIVNKMWPFDVARLDLVRAVAQDRVEATSILEAANNDAIFAFLAAVLMVAVGLALPIAFVLNKRFGLTAGTTVPQFFVTFRQAMWVGLWASFTIWLQMNRALSLAITLLVAIVLTLFEFLLQVRARAQTSS